MAVVVTSPNEQTYVVVGLIPLNHRCQPTDRCEDPAASCYAGFCLCHATHYELNNRCSTFILRFPHVVGGD